MSPEERKQYRNDFLVALAGAFVGGVLFFLPLGNAPNTLGRVG